MTDQEYDALINSMSSGSPSYDDLDFRDLSFDFDTSGVENLDLSGLSGMNFDSLGLEGMLAENFNIGGLDLPQDFNFDPNVLSEINTGGADLDALIDSMGSQGISGLEDVELGDERVLRDFYIEDMMKSGSQNFGSSVDMDKSMGDFNTNMQDIFDNGGFTSQWQNVDGRKVQVYDDGTGMAINPSTGASRSLSENEITSLIKAGKLNTFKSGYNTATGGNETAPGGGSSVILKDGSKGTLLTTGRVIDDKGTVIGKEEDVKTKIINTGGDTTKTDTTKTDTTKTDTTKTTTTPTKTTTTPTKTDSLGSLLPLLLALLAMNRGGGGGGESKGAVIPGLTATQRQTPYAQQQRAPGYRPGQGGISYFDQTQYAPKMAAGGIARLLDGPGDGVSDSIPAVIDSGMAGGGQPAKVARGEYIFDARSVAALGNGSTDAGAERLDKMRKDILRDDRKAKIGEDSKAYRHLLA
jgi:hypothetical protein